MYFRNFTACATVKPSAVCAKSNFCKPGAIPNPCRKNTKSYSRRTRKIEQIKSTQNMYQIRLLSIMCQTKSASIMRQTKLARSICQTKLNLRQLCAKPTVVKHVPNLSCVEHQTPRIYINQFRPA